jgi:N-carbamoylputrescine amidase
MVLFSELSVAGYIPNYSLWDILKDNCFDIINWMRETSRKYKIYLGVGLFEYINNEIRNTYIITGPEGNIEGRAEKDHAEAYIFKMGNGVHIIKIKDIKIGVCICADNHFTDVIEIIQKENVSILLMPHAWPTPFKTGGGLKEEDLISQNDELKNLPVKIAKLVNAPVVFINQIGIMDRMIGIFGKFMTPDNFCLQGHSRIIDSEGSVLSEIDVREGIIYSNVELKKNTAIKYTPVPNFDGWIHEGSKFIRKIIAPIDIKIGQKRYRKMLSKYIKDNHLTIAST